MPSFSFAEMCVVLFVSFILFTPREIIKFIQNSILFFEKLKDEFETKKNEIIMLPEEDEFETKKNLNPEILEEFCQKNSQKNDRNP